MDTPTSKPSAGSQSDVDAEESGDGTGSEEEEASAIMADSPSDDASSIPLQEQIINP